MDPNNPEWMLKREKQRYIAANILLEVYSSEKIIIVQDELMLFSRDQKFWSWSAKGEPAEMYFSTNHYHFYKWQCMLQLIPSETYFIC